MFQVFSFQHDDSNMMIFQAIFVGIIIRVESTIKNGFI